MSRQRWIVLVLVAAVIAGLALWLPWQPPRPAAAVSAHQIPWPLRGLLFAPALDGNVVDAAGAIGATGSTAIEVCGIGLVQVNSMQELLPELLATATRSPTLRRSIAELGATSEPSNRAIALHYDAVLAAQGAIDAALAGNRDCANNEHCRSAADEMGTQAAAPYRQALVQLADQNNDPIAFALAYKACRRPSAPRIDACSGVTASRWAESDPDNGTPWLLVAAEAARVGDQTTRGEAMRHAAAAKRFDHYNEALLRPLATASVQDAARIDRFVVQTTTVGVFAAAPVTGYAEIATLCDSNALAEPQRRTQCDRLATVLVEADSTMLGLLMGARLGERVGWPAQRVAALKEQLDAINGLSLDPRVQPGRWLGCEAFDLLQQRSSDMLRLGETGALRRAIAESGRPVAELAREWRDYVRREQERAQAAQQK